MNHRSKPLCAAVLSALVVGGGALARADEPTTQPDVAAELKALRARIDQLEAQQREQEQKRRQDAQKQHEASALNSVLNDADRKSRLFDEGALTAGYKDHRFFIQSEEGDFVWRPWLHLQLRYVGSDRQDNKPTGNDELDQGFEIRRIRFGFDGNLFGPDFTYFVNWATVRASGGATSGGQSVAIASNNLGGVPVLEEAWTKYHFHDTPFFVWSGQIKDPVSHDQQISSRYFHGPERTLIGDIFLNGDAFTEGATFIYDPAKDFRAQAGVNHGLRSANTNFFDFPTQNAFDFGVVGRAEYKVFGRWSDFGQIGAIETKEPLLVFGLGADSSQRGHATQTVAALDAYYSHPAGFSFYGQLVDRYTTHNFGIAIQSPTGANIVAPPPSVANRPTNEFGVSGEVGYVFNNFIEPYGRIEYLHLAGTAAASDNWVQVYSAGVNFYFQGNRLKLTPQIMYLPRGIPIDDGPNDVFATKPGKGEIVGEIQLQYLL